MSRTYSATKNKHQKHSKVHYHAYLYSASEPAEKILESMPAELEAELLNDFVSARREIWHLASKMRDQYA